MTYEPLYNLIRKYEGFYSKRYKCPAGIWTIGYGHTAGVTEASQPITKAVAEALLEDDAEIAVRAALNLSPNLDGDRLCAIADFIFNLGSGRYRASTLRKRVNEQDWEGAQEQVMKWVWGGGKKLPGLVARREEEARLLCS